MAIKNFKAPTTKEEKDYTDKIFVSKYMTTKLITFKADQSVLEVMELLIKNKISGGPVVNDNNQLLGIISEGDCMKQIAESGYYNVPMNDVKVEDHMVKDVETITSGMSIFDVASLFYKSKRKRFPVVDNGELVGQISRRDVLKAALALKDI
ncbi:CBS domain-containing protein [Flavicella sp.]|uniref:CBS domain-containing protein n=1 Tax=Flavicella sp. TaxID=2957742 RepID=UPI00262BB843|nr:CBS domain-containing protein [Flavicella sp.]MDG1805018.1 CBS domain-containing protein [Flavicella sp.]MDG2281094.1 CBS domain-containing protein [Flavicella sp.]